MLELLDRDKTLNEIHTNHPYYSTRRIVKLLNRMGFKVSRKLAKRALEFMGIVAS